MCGIAGIISKGSTSLPINEKIVSMSHAIRHRGPDGEGFMFVTNKRATPYFDRLQSHYTHTELPYIPKSHITESRGETHIAFAHRRLSIIELSEFGHQPMCNPSETCWITYNGEIYNYLELKAELKNAGHTFISGSDTEVILHAYKEWGTDCVKRFNGMWSFCIYDSEKQVCFASRDRLGVKPFYYVNTTGFFAFASEQKAFIKSGLIQAHINQKALHSYLINGLLENETANFFEEVIELWPGTNLVFDLRSKTVSTSAYYDLRNEINLTNDRLSEPELIDRVSAAFENAVKLRLRSDVEVGTCLSGGIDSSALAVSISEITQQPLYCFTAVFSGEPFNEGAFADAVAKKINAKHFKTEPTLSGFEKDVDQLIYSQDVPIWSTSTYAQYKVMELAKQNGIKVVLDGQGADELFGGYHHHFTAKWNNLISEHHYLAAMKDILQSNKTISGSLLFFLKERLKQTHNFQKKRFTPFFKSEFISAHEIKNPVPSFNNLNEQLVDDIYETRLKSFLKCEDRCGMWHSVESRTPFSDDVELINLMFSFNGNKKIKDGVSKHLLREAVKSKLPPEIYSRYDKKGFETPMKKWVSALNPKFLSEIREADLPFLNHKALEQCDLNDPFNYKLVFKLFVLSRWQKLFLQNNFPE